jgi:hypothetical protein
MPLPKLSILHRSETQEFSMDVLVKLMLRVATRFECLAAGVCVFGVVRFHEGLGVRYKWRALRC